MSTRVTTPEPTRQVHLDFHTSEHVPGVGARFSRAQFQGALTTGHVNLVNVFAKCHHGWSYYPTTVGQKHPHLEIDLLGAQIEACHEIGVRAPIYYTVGWSAIDAEQHPEWVLRTRDWERGTFKEWDEKAPPDTPRPPFHWIHLCTNTGYGELIESQVDEICRSYDTDGMFFDIYWPHVPCYCDSCRSMMARANVDIDDYNAVIEFRSLSIKRQTSRMVDTIHSYHPQATTFFNCLNYIHRPENFAYRLFDTNTKNDLEDLPTTWGGYDKFPLRVKRFHREQKPVVGMSGKFHTSWGEFGGFKDREAMRFEAASMIAYGACVNFGDQMHPSGLMDETTYANIGHAYQYVKRIEEYGIGGTPVASLGVVPTYHEASDEGVSRLLLEAQIDFDVVLPEDDLSRLKAIVVPSLADIDAQFQARLAEWVADGGSLLICGDANHSLAALSGTISVQDPATDVDYTLLSPDGAAHLSRARSETLARPHRLPRTPFLNYEAAQRFTLKERATVLAALVEPYFSRTYGHYCGHQNTPNSDAPSGYPAVWRNGNVVGFAHNVDRMYHAHGAKVHRDLFQAALQLVFSEPMAEVELPSGGRLSLLHQPAHDRYVAHVLYGVPVNRGNCSVIEDLPEFRDVRMRLRLPKALKRVRLIPDDTELKPSLVNGVVELAIPAFACHCAVVAEY